MSNHLAGVVASALNRVCEQIDHDAPGRGTDKLSDDRRLEWPAAYALYASAEAERWRRWSSVGADRRAIHAARWLLERAQEPHFGGWGIPVERDSMRIGSTHPTSTPLAVPTALAVTALVDTYPLLDPQLRQTASRAIAAAVSQFNATRRDLDGDRSWLLYAGDPNRAFAVVNSNALFAGALHRATSIPGALPRDAAGLGARIARWVLGTRLPDSEQPAWPYYGSPAPPDGRRGRPNDLLHEAYVWIGLASGHADWLPQALTPLSVDAAAATFVHRYLDGGRLRELPVEYGDRVASRPGRSWQRRARLRREASLSSLGAALDALGVSVSDSASLERTALPVLHQLHTELDGTSLGVRTLMTVYRGLVRLSSREP